MYYTHVLKSTYGKFRFVFLLFVTVLSSNVSVCEHLDDSFADAQIAWLEATDREATVEATARKLGFSPQAVDLLVEILSDAEQVREQAIELRNTALEEAEQKDIFLVESLARYYMEPVEIEIHPQGTVERRKYTGPDSMEIGPWEDYRFNMMRLTLMSDLSSLMSLPDGVLVDEWKRARAGEDVSPMIQDYDDLRKRFEAREKGWPDSDLDKESADYLIQSMILDFYLTGSPEILETMLQFKASQPHAFYLFPYLEQDALEALEDLYFQSILQGGTGAFQSSYLPIVDRMQDREVMQQIAELVFVFEPSPMTAEYMARFFDPEILEANPELRSAMSFWASTQRLRITELQEAINAVEESVGETDEPASSPQPTTP